MTSPSIERAVEAAKAWDKSDFHNDAATQRLEEALPNDMAWGFACGYLAGRDAAIEDAAKIADGYDTNENAYSNWADFIAREIRALKETP